MAVVNQINKETYWGIIMLLQIISDALQCSQATIYRYLTQVRKEPVEAVGVDP